MVLKWYVARLLISPLNKILCKRKPQPHLSSSLKSLIDCLRVIQMVKEETGAAGGVEDFA